MTNICPPAQQQYIWLSEAHIWFMGEQRARGSPGRKRYTIYLFIHLFIAHDFKTFEEKKA